MHPFERQLAKEARASGMLPPGSGVLVACSGGADSTALLSALASLQRALCIRVEAVHVDHMLRGEESAEDLRFVQRLSERLGVAFHAASIPVRERMEPGDNLQAACRRERYAFFAEQMRAAHCSILATAHHRDDQAETALMALVKGVPPGLLSFLRKARPFGGGTLVRPFLARSRAEIEAYLADCEQPYRTDPSNAKDSYARNRYRHRILPLLTRENPQAPAALAALAARLQEDEDVLSALARERFERFVARHEDGSLTFSTAWFSHEPPALQRRVILLVLRYLSGPRFRETNGRLLESLRQLSCGASGSARVELPAGFCAVRTYGEVTVSRAAPAGSSPAPLALEAERWYALPSGGRLLWAGLDALPQPIAPTAQRRYFCAAAVSFPLQLRAPRPGDRIQLPGLAGEKKLSRLFIDEKIPRALRESWPILADAGGAVYAALGIRFSSLLSAEPRAGADAALLLDERKDTD